MSSDSLSARKSIPCQPYDGNCTTVVENLSAWNSSGASAYRLVELNPVATSVSLQLMFHSVFFLTLLHLAVVGRLILHFRWALRNVFF